MPSAIPPANPLGFKQIITPSGIGKQNPLQSKAISTPARRVHKKRKRPRLTNFAEPTPLDPDELQIVKIVKRSPAVQQGEEAVKPEVKPTDGPVLTPASTPALTTASTPALTPAATPVAPPRPHASKGKQPIETIDLTNEEEAEISPEAYRLPPEPQTTNATPNGFLLPPSQQNLPPLSSMPAPIHPPKHSTRIELPEPRQSRSAGYHRNHQGARYKVLPAGFGGLDLARSHFGRSRSRWEGEHEARRESEKKVGREMKYTLRRHVEEYWR